MENEISSPTFTIVNEYVSKDVTIYHFDLYRLQNLNDFVNIGGEDYLSKGICIIEWGELIEDILPAGYIKITITKDVENENTRIIEVNK